jgi:hypothetical protein
MLNSMWESTFLNILPQWITNISTFSSIVGLIITIWLLIVAKGIRKSFLRKARVPQITEQLFKLLLELDTNLKNWETEQKDAIKNLAICKGLLENLKPKLDNDEEKNCKNMISKLTIKKYMFLNGNLSDIKEDFAWDLYNELNTLTTKLMQLDKDSKWD